MIGKWMLAAIAAPIAAAALAATDVNRADQATLETVKGIGPSLSTQILDERAKAPFKDWADLLARVKGLGAATASSLSAAGLTVDGATFDRPSAARK